MKIALIAFRFGPSHGSILQTYALTRILENLGHEVTIINRQKPITWKRYLSCFYRILRALLHKNFSPHLIYLGEYPPVLMKMINIFVQKELYKQTITVSKIKELKKIEKGGYDAYIVGSDQTWRPKYVYNIYDYFLGFLPAEKKVKRISYAASFGTSNWEYKPEQEEKCKKLVGLFDGVSVRETDGIIMCKKHFGIEATHVLDPTMLLFPDQYLKIINFRKKQCEPYLGYNILDNSEEKLKIINIVGSILEKRTIQINTQTENSNAKIADRVAPSIDDWISSIALSDYIVVDSFHATVFSILFHKPFICIGNENRGMSRFISLLSMLGLENRLITKAEQIDRQLVESPIDWKVIDNKIEAMRQKSIGFIIDVLK